MSKKAKAPYIGIDLGGTKVLAAVISHKGKIIAKAKNATPSKEGPEAVVSRIVETVEQAAKKADVSISDVHGAGIGTPGVVDASTGMVRYAPNLAGWEEVPLGPALEVGLNLPVIVGNDVDVAAFGEYSLGVSKKCNSMVGIFPGTGIGGALIIDGKLHKGARGSAAEIGHVAILADGPLCGCGRRGCAEALASRTALERDLRTALSFGQSSVLSEMVQPHERIRSGVLAKAARAGDRLVLETLARTGRYLGILAGSVCNFIDPEVVMFGGGLIEACEEWLMPTIRQTTVAYLINRLDTDKVRIETATLGDNAGILGAAMLARATYPRK